MTIDDAFQCLFDDTKYVPDPISIEGYEAYLKKQPISSCPYTDVKKKELWEHGWITTDIGHVKAAEFGDEKYDDPVYWDTNNKLKKLYQKYYEK